MKELTKEMEKRVEDILGYEYFEPGSEEEEDNYRPISDIMGLKSGLIEAMRAVRSEAIEEMLRKREFCINCPWCEKWKDEDGKFIEAPLTR